MVSKTEFKAKLDGSFERKLRAAYVAGYQDGYDEGAYGGTGYTTEEVESMFQSWLKDPQRHRGFAMEVEI